MRHWDRCPCLTRELGTVLGVNCNDICGGGRMYKFYCWFLGRSWPETVLKVSFPKRAIGGPLEVQRSEWKLLAEGGIFHVRGSSAFTADEPLTRWQISVFPLPAVRSCLSVTQRTLTPHDNGTPLPAQLTPIESHSLLRKGEGGAEESP